ncbi:MAG: hypothetical protein R3B82_03465 [Sandaracinaceae bacterium]
MRFALIALAGALLGGCGLVVDLDPRLDAAVGFDAAVSDAAVSDAAVRDAAVRDAAVRDAEAEVDAGRSDGGRDACVSRPELCNAVDDDCDGAIDEDYMLLSDPLRCGGCTTVCPAFTTATATCIGGTCGFECIPGFADCDGRGDNGCEADIATDLDNCGFCGSVCFSDPHGRQECRMGMCVVADCGDGRADCNLVASDGCEASLSSAEHCGSCGTRCMAGQVCLATGVCGPPG